jgi:hypothetical protein
MFHAGGLLRTELYISFLEALNLYEISEAFPTWSPQMYSLWLVITVFSCWIKIYLFKHIITKQITAMCEVQ